jgi:hypothetical protein
MPQGNEKSMWFSVRAAFSSWWTVLGLMAASVTGFNLVRKLVDIGLAQVLSDLFAVYQQWVHFPVEWIFALFRLPPPPGWAIDLALFWVLIGSVVLRSAWVQRADAIKRKRQVNTTWGRFFEALLEKRIAFPFFLLVFVVLWPIGVMYFLSHPHLQRMKTGSLTSGTTRYPTYTYICDMRIVLATQAMAALVCVSAWAVLNLMLSLYQ